MKHRPPSRPSKRAAAAGMALLAPTPERLTHSRVARAQDTLADANGNIGQPWVAEGMLARMLRQGEIGANQWYAGLLFGEMFHDAALHPLRAADLARQAAGSAGPNGIERARRQVHAALDALGGIASPIGSIAWFVLGCEISIAEWCRREGWHGRSLRHETGRVTLVGALSVLAKHFRLDNDCA